jgi:hypothetical protein
MVGMSKKVIDNKEGKKRSSGLVGRETATIT